MASEYHRRGSEDSRRHNIDDIVAGDVERIPTVYPELNAVTVEPGDDALQAGRPADVALAAGELTSVVSKVPVTMLVPRRRALVGRVCANGSSTSTSSTARTFAGA